jgi:hypothetical protein
MIALLGSLLGFGTSFLPQVLEFFQKKQEHKNRLEEIKLKGELYAQGVNLELQVLDKKAEIEETKRLYEFANVKEGWAAQLAGSVRPVVTYMFVLLFIATKGVVMYKFVQEGGDWMGAVEVLNDEEFQSLFACVISFWFGTRAMQKIGKK